MPCWCYYYSVSPSSNRSCILTNKSFARGTWGPRQTPEPSQPFRFHETINIYWVCLCVWSLLRVSLQPPGRCAHCSKPRRCKQNAKRHIRHRWRNKNCLNKITNERGESLYVLASNLSWKGATEHTARAEGVGPRCRRQVTSVPAPQERRWDKETLGRSPVTLLGLPALHSVGVTAALIRMRSSPAEEQDEGLLWTKSITRGPSAWPSALVWRVNSGGGGWKREEFTETNAV